MDIVQQALWAEVQLSGVLMPESFNSLHIQEDRYQLNNRVVCVLFEIFDMSHGPIDIYFLDEAFNLDEFLAKSFAKK